MCGIIYYKSFTGRGVNRKVFRHYLKQRERGSEGFGFVGVSERKLLICRATQEGGIKFLLGRKPLSEILFHHRMPTSTANTLRTTHPIVVSQPLYDHRYYLIHNGVITNADELRTKHEEMGVTYTTPQISRRMDCWGRSGTLYEFNDSEALAHEVALFLEDKQKMIEAQGDMAFICLETDRGNRALKLHFGRNHGAPLQMSRSSHHLVIASQHVSSRDVQPHQLYTYDYRSREITRRRVELLEYNLSGHYGFGVDNWGMLDELEEMIREHERELMRLRDARAEASIRGDMTDYRRLKREKEQVEERLDRLYEEQYRLKRWIFYY